MSSFAIDQPLVPSSSYSEGLNTALLANFAKDRTLRPISVALSTIKTVGYIGITIAGRLPYYFMCYKVFPDNPIWGAVLGTSYSISWGTIVFQSCYDLEDGVRARMSIRDSSDKTSLMAETAKVTAAVVLSILGECALFSVAYLANDKSVPMLCCSFINAAIPTYSLYLTINAFLRRQRFTEADKSFKQKQDLFLDKCDHIIKDLPRHPDLPILKNYLERLQDPSLHPDDKIGALKALIRSINRERLPVTSASYGTRTAKILQILAAAYLASIYLAWTGYLTYLGGKEISPVLDGLWITLGLIAVFANLYFMSIRMYTISTAVPNTAYQFLCGKRNHSFTANYYPILSISLKIVAISLCLLSFGPATIISKQNLSSGWAIASTASLSTAMTLAPMIPLTQGIDSFIAHTAEYFGPHKKDFSLENRLKDLRFILSCATEKAAVEAIEENLQPLLP